MTEISSEKIRSALFDSALNTFADMAFLDMTEKPVVGEEVSKHERLAIDILKPFTGRLVLTLSQQLKTQIIENIYAQKSVELQANEQEDCILEILNVIAGVFLSECYGKNSDYKIEFPELEMMDIPEGGQILATVCFDVEGMDLRLDLYSIIYQK